MPDGNRNSSQQNLKIICLGRAYYFSKRIITLNIACFNSIAIIISIKPICLCYHVNPVKSDGCRLVFHGKKATSKATMDFKQNVFNTRHIILYF